MMTPFFMLSVFVSLTKHMTSEEKKSVITKFGMAITIVILVFLLFGKYSFNLFGITLDAFKIGAGSVLFLSAVDMIRGDADSPDQRNKQGLDFAIVPLAIPVTIGPGMIVMGAEIETIMNFVQIAFALLGRC